MVSNKRPESAFSKCDKTGEEFINLARELKVNGTPSFGMEDGRQFRGGMPLAKLKSRLGQ
jgi:protein-disulfide isomerase